MSTIPELMQQLQDKEAGGVPEAAMLERVARAISPMAFERLPGHERGRCPACDSGEAAALALGRAAIEAMREPTPEMVAAAIRVPREAYWPGHKSPAHWRAMVDAALGEVGN